jgi:hypothetical protein
MTHAPRRRPRTAKAAAPRANAEHNISFSRNQREKPLKGFRCEACDYVISEKDRKRGFSR